MHFFFAEKEKEKKTSLSSPFSSPSLNALGGGAFRVEYHQFDERPFHLSSPLDDVVALCGQGPGGEDAKRLFDDGGAVVVDFDFNDSSPDSRARVVFLPSQDLWCLAQVRRGAILYIDIVEFRKKQQRKR